MKHFDYFAPTEIIFGAGRVTEAGALAARYGKKAMLVTSSVVGFGITPS